MFWFSYEVFFFLPLVKSLNIEKIKIINWQISVLAANREAAFVHAISSAGVMYTLTRNCSLGDFDNCGCDDSRNGQRGEICYKIHI